jgi:hypothetical protein
MVFLPNANKLCGPQSASELYRLIDRGLSTKFCANFCGWRGVAWSMRRIPTVVNLAFLDRSRYFSFKQLIYPHKGRVDPVPDPLLPRKSGSAGNRIRDLWVSSQEV